MAWRDSASATARSAACFSATGHFTSARKSSSFVLASDSTLLALAHSLSAAALSLQRRSRKASMCCSGRTGHASLDASKILKDLKILRCSTLKYCCELWSSVAPGSVFTHSFDLVPTCHIAPHCTLKTKQLGRITTPNLTKRNCQKCAQTSSHRQATQNSLICNNAIRSQSESAMLNHLLSVCSASEGHAVRNLPRQNVI